MHTHKDAYVTNEMDNNRRAGEEVWRNWNLKHCLWNYKMMQPLYKQYLKR